MCEKFLTQPNPHRPIFRPFCVTASLLIMRIKGEAYDINYRSQASFSILNNTINTILITLIYLSFLLFRKVKAAVLDRLGDVFHADLLRTVQIRDGSGHTEDPVIASCRKPHGVKGVPHQRFPFF